MSASPDSGRRGHSVEVGRAIGQVLFIGGIASLTLVLLGLGILAGTEGLRAPMHLERSPVSDDRSLPPHIFTSIPQILGHLSGFSFDPLALVALGLVALVSTPVLAVVTAAVTFAHQRDREYSSIATIVLGLLVLGLLLAGGG